jgi:hypothetical protein
LKEAALKRITLPAIVLLVAWFFTMPLTALPQAAAPAKPAEVKAKAGITTPKEFLGSNIGDDYFLANYQQLMGYWKKLAQESDRMKLVEIGKSEEGRPQLMSIVTSAANHKKLAYYQEISRKMAKAEGVSAEDAARLAAEGKAVVWIDGGLHANEVLCAQVLIESMYQFLVADDPESLRILNDCIILFVHANPDGMDLLADHYMSNKDPKKRTTQNLPRLYQKYIGHDNNRDFYANTQSETKNMNRVMYREWMPQIVYNHHQTGPPGSVLFCPPFRDPFNYNVHPMAISGIDAVGAAMMLRFLAEGKPGATVRSGAPYSTWFNGGLRTTAHFHNMIGLLTETIGHPTPMNIGFNPSKQLPKADYLSPIAPQAWHFRQSVDYSVTANKAVLDYASRQRELLLHNIWVMGKDGIEAGNRDHWTVTPKMVEAAGGGGGGKGGKGGKGGGGKGGGKGGGEAVTKEFDRFFRDPAKRDARAYVIPSNQPDFLTATKFINVLIATGCAVHRATAPFEIGGKQYPQGSYVVKTAQAFRPHVLDMFEPQDHPNDFAYPGAPPTRPYDSAGYTLAFQMAVKFDRILEGVDGPFEVLQDEVPPPPAKVADAEGAVGFFLSARTNDAFRAVNQLMKAGEEVFRLQKSFVIEDAVHPAGMFYIPRKAGTVENLKKVASSLGTRFRGTTVQPKDEAVALRPVRIGLWDRFGGSMPSGWTRWLLERFEYSFKVVMTDELDQGDLRERFDVLIFVDDAIGLKGGGGRGIGQDNVPLLKKFLEKGGTVLAIGGSTALGKMLGLPIANHLASKEDGTALGSDKFYVPTSVLHVKLDPTNPLTWGMADEADVMFSQSPTFRLPEDAAKNGLAKVAWFDSATPLRSGWAWGQQHLEGGVAMIDAKVGQGRLALFGPQILFRAQPHGTFKLLFNGIVQAGLVE